MNDKDYITIWLLGLLALLLLVLLLSPAIAKAYVDKAYDTSTKVLEVINK